MFADLTRSIILRLLLAAGLGAAVGLERGLHRKPAGMRTSLFICLGSALFTILSEQISRQYGEPSATRIVSNLIPGIGFLGAGAILRDRGSVTGLTTAATIFVMAGVGMAAGAGHGMTAVFTTVLILFALTVFGKLEDLLGLKRRLVTFRITTPMADEVMVRAHNLLDELKLPMQHLQVSRLGAESVIEFDAEVSHSQMEQLTARLSSLGARCEAVPIETTRE